ICESCSGTAWRRRRWRRTCASFSTPPDEKKTGPKPRCRIVQRSGSVERRELLLHFLQCLGFDLPDSLGRDAELARQLVQRLRVRFRQPARLDDRAAALVEVLEGAGEAPAAKRDGLDALEDVRRAFGRVG